MGACGDCKLLLGEISVFFLSVCAWLLTMLVHIFYIRCSGNEKSVCKEITH